MTSTQTNTNVGSVPRYNRTVERMYRMLLLLLLASLAAAGVLGGVAGANRSQSAPAPSESDQIWLNAWKVERANLEQRINEAVRDYEEAKKKLLELGAKVAVPESRPDVSKLLTRLDRAEKTVAGVKTDYEGAKKKLDELDMELARLKGNPVPAPKGGPPDTAVTGQIRKLESAVGELRKTIDDDQRSRKKIDQATEKTLKTLDGEVKTLTDKVRKSLEQALREAGEEKGKRLRAESALEKSKPEPTDVLVVAMHSGNLSLANHLDGILQLVHPAKRSLPPGCRVGFMLFDGGEDVVHLPFAGLSPAELKEADKKLSDLRGGTDDTADHLDAAVEPVAKAFKESKAKRRRCVLIASTACVPAASNRLAKWKDLDVFVILIGKNGQPRDLREKRLLDWYRFGQDCGGAVTLIAARGEPKEADALLKAQLRTLLIQTTQPVHATAKAP